MSIKSQKSLNDECSEIFERSYSVKSVSDESLSGEEEDDTLARILLNKMKPSILSKLRKCFKKGKDKSAKVIDRKVEEVMRLAAAEEGIEFATTAIPCDDPLWLDKKSFVRAIERIFGNHKYTPHAHALFTQLDKWSVGRVWWGQVVARLESGLEARVNAWAEAPARSGGVFKLSLFKREVIIKVVSIETVDTFCYVAISRGGKVGIYDGHLKMLHSYEIFFHRTGVKRRVKNCWITDAVYLNDAKSLIMSASDRSLTVYDVSTLTHTPVYCITGLPNIPTCLAYSPLEVGGTSSLVLGTERGDLIQITFHQPRVALFYNKTPENINFYFWMELSSFPHSHYCSMTQLRAHKQPVRRVSWSGEVVFSCSHDQKSSLRAKCSKASLADYVYNVQRGITCFHWVSSLQTGVSGSLDGGIRMWTAGVLVHTACLTAPRPAPIVDVMMIPSRNVIVGLDTNCCLHLWDLYEECLLQTIKLEFPFLGVHGKKAEFGTYSIFPGPARYPVENQDSDDEDGLKELEKEYKEPSKLEQDLEYIRTNRPDIIVTCCSYICRVVLSPSEDSRLILPAPADTLAARRPSMWDVPTPSVGTPMTMTPSSGRSEKKVFQPVLPKLQTNTEELDALLENAGLQGILEKDFVLMQGLKHDLNKKLADMEANMDALNEAISIGAPYLGLKTYEPDPLLPGDYKMEEFHRVMKLFPGASVGGTPSGSNHSTPRRRKASKL